MAERIRLTSRRMANPLPPAGFVPFGNAPPSYDGSVPLPPVGPRAPMPSGYADERAAQPPMMTTSTGHQFPIPPAPYGPRAPMPSGYADERPANQPMINTSGGHQFTKPPPPVGPRAPMPSGYADERAAQPPMRRQPNTNSLPPAGFVPYGNVPPSYDGSVPPPPSWPRSNVVGSRRRAAPNSHSGENPNTPIKLYDTHPNQRFAIGEDVILMDPTDVGVRGTVLGHIAEDRILVQWPHMVTQEDTDDVIALRETSWRGLSSEVQALAGGFDHKTASRQAGFLDAVNPWSESRQTQRVRTQADDAGGYTKFNLFSDPKVQTILKRYGLTDKEIQNYSTLRQRQLETMQGRKKTPQWGQGSNHSFNALPPVPKVKTPAPYTIDDSSLTNNIPAVSAGTRKIHRAANLIDGILDDPDLARHARLLPMIASLTHTTGRRSASAAKSLARLAMVIADEVRDSQNQHSEKIAEMLEDGVVEATPLGT